MTPAEPIAPWRSPLGRAIHRNRALAFSRYLQLATVRADGSPANRTVVFRGFLAQTNHLMFVTDSRSEKIGQLNQQPQAEACWYFTKTREQFRISGTLTITAAETDYEVLAQARSQLWQKLSDAARLQFSWPEPKAPYSDPEAFDLPLPNAQTPLPNFCLLTLAATHIDHLELRGNPQRRTLYHLATHPNRAPSPAALSAPDSHTPWLTALVNP